MNFEEEIQRKQEISSSVYELEDSQGISMLEEESTLERFGLMHIEKPSIPPSFHCIYNLNKCVCLMVF